MSFMSMSIASSSSIEMGLFLCEISTLLGATIYMLSGAGSKYLKQESRQKPALHNLLGGME